MCETKKDMKQIMYDALEKFIIENNPTIFESTLAKIGGIGFYDIKIYKNESIEIHGQKFELPTTYFVRHRKYNTEYIHHITIK